MYTHILSSHLHCITQVGDELVANRTASHAVDDIFQVIKAVAAHWPGRASGVQVDDRDASKNGLE